MTSQQQQRQQQRINNHLMDAENHPMKGGSGDSYVQITHVDARDDEDKVAELHMACKMGSLGQVLTLLKEMDANATGRERNGKTALMVGIDYVHDHREYGVIEACLQHGARVEYDVLGKSPLMYAVDVAPMKGDWRVVELLMDAGADATQCDDKGNNPFMLAAAKGLSDILECMVKKGVDVEFVSGPPRPYGLGMTALQAAASNGRVDAVKTLLRLGAKADNAALLDACTVKGNREIVCMLLDRGADPTGALEVASAWGDVGIVRALLMHPQVCVTEMALENARSRKRDQMESVLLESKAS